MEAHLTKDEKKRLRQEEWSENLKKQQTRNKLKVVGYWLLGVCILGVVIWALVAATNQPASSSSVTIPAVSASDFQTGVQPSTSSGQAISSGKKVVTLVEYADFQCPACKAYYPLIKQLQQDYAGKLRFVYRMFPLENVHKNALNSAKAAYAANMQGKFWEMHDKLFETQDSWAQLPDPESTFVGYAKELGLNLDQFKKDYEADSTAKFVNDAYNNGLNLGLPGTPTFFVNGKQIDNPQGYQPFRTVIDNALK